jgi:hypothetical protein
MTARDLHDRLGRLLDERVIDTAPHRFTPRTGIPCPYCARWLGSWVMLGIHVDGHVKAAELLKRIWRERASRKESS